MLKVDFVLENISGKFSSPDFNEWEIISGPNITSSFTKINGEISQRKSYSFTIKPLHSGILYIGSASVINDTIELKTEPVKCTVLDRDIHSGISDLQPIQKPKMHKSLPSDTIKSKRKLIKF